jgi:hypothetical protein
MGRSRFQLHRKSIAAALTVVSLASAGWGDPIGDLLDGSPPPALDLTRVTTSLQPGFLVVRMEFDPSAAQPSDMNELSGFVDFDVDSNPQTGTSSHIESLLPPPAPYPSIGVDYFLAIYPGFALAELYLVTAEEAVSINLYDVVFEGMSAVLEVPLCQNNDPYTGICIDGRYDLVALLGNGNGFTDRIPNDASVLKRPVADFDSDGIVGLADVSHMRLCRTGASIPQNDPQCYAADLDADTDVDQDDFGLLQREFGLSD